MRRLAWVGSLGTWVAAAAKQRLRWLGAVYASDQAYLAGLLLAVGLLAVLLSLFLMVSVPAGEGLNAEVTLPRLEERANSWGLAHNPE